MFELRLGDDVDDYCIKCKRLTNHSILSLVDGQPAKVRCRACYNEGYFRNCEVPPSKKDLRKAELFNTVLGSIPGAAVESEPEAPAEAPAEKKRAARKKS